MKVLVAHSGTQHSMRLAVALKKLGHEVKYVTTVYNKKNSLTRFVSRFLKGNTLTRAEARKNDELLDSEVRQVYELYGLCVLLVNRIDKKKRFYNYMTHCMRKKFGSKITKMAADYDVVFMFDTQAAYTFENLNKKKSKCVKIIDYSATYSEYSLELYKELIDRFPQYATELFNEQKILRDTKIIELYRREMLESDYALTASNFVKSSILKYQPNKKCFVVPYGASFNIERKEKVLTEKLKVLYVGNVRVMKGIPFVFEALSNIKDVNLEVVFVGSVTENMKALAKGDCRCRFVGQIPHNDVKKYLQDADVFLFPSIADGFGIAPLEAMYYGVPCIISKNAGVSDLIEDTKNGFLIPAMDAKAIQEKLEWCLLHRQELIEMREEIYKTAEKYTWDNYAQGLKEVLKEIGME